MVVHLESGITTAACEAHYMVLAVIYHDSRLIDGDVICPHVEDDTDFSLILQVKNKECETNISLHIHSKYADYIEFFVYFRVVEPEILF